MERLVILEPSLEGFMMDVQPYGPHSQFRRAVRLNRSSRLLGGGVMPNKAFYIDLFGIPAEGEIAWLHREMVVPWVSSEPAYPDHRYKVDAFDILHEMLKEFLAWFYDVREGLFGIGKSIDPLNGSIECATIEKTDDGEFLVTRNDNFLEKMMAEFGYGNDTRTDHR